FDLATTAVYSLSLHDALPIYTLQQVEEVQVFYLREAKAVKDADIVLLPGSKSTIADLLYLRQNGMEAAILQHHQSNKPLYGICGGFQMMGQSIRSEEHTSELQSRENLVCRLLLEK